MKTQFEHNGNLYETQPIKVKNTVYNVTTKTNGSLKNVNVIKVTNNPFRSLGKDFETFEKAIEKYKHPELIMGIKKIQKEYEKR